MPQLDHLILAVNDLKASVYFYTRILGTTYDGEREPFSVIRVMPSFVIQLAP
jgi:catechol 2,3-dioxygenase-like lactoylglutathione lyase family enzyme